MQSWFRRTGSEVLGWVLVAAGIVLMPLPGPGLFVLVAGVALLAPHYAWARRMLDPLRERAVRGARRGVQSKRHIFFSTLGVAWFVGFGILWLASPTIPVFGFFGLTVGPELPGGRAAGIGLLASGIAGGILLVYSVKRWYPGASEPGS